MGVLIVILTVILVLVSVALVGLILIQQGKGGGLVAFGGSGVEQAFGTHAATLAQKATATLGALFLLLVIVLGLLRRSDIRPFAPMPANAPTESAPPGEAK